MKSRKKRLREVYVWELPVRIYHWVNALCIVILCVTGFIIAILRDRDVRIFFIQNNSLIIQVF